MISRSHTLLDRLITGFCVSGPGETVRTLRTCHSIIGSQSDIPPNLASEQGTLLSNEYVNLAHHHPELYLYPSAQTQDPFSTAFSREPAACAPETSSSRLSYTRNAELVLGVVRKKARQGARRSQFRLETIWCRDQLQLSVRP